MSNLTEWLASLDVERLLRAAYHAQDSQWVKEQWQAYQQLQKEEKQHVDTLPNRP